MIVGRVIGWVLLLVGLVILARDVLVLGAGYDDKPHGAPIVLGELWYAIHPNSLQLLQPAIQRHLHPALWDWVVQPALLSWAWVVFTALGFAFLVLFQRRTGRLRRRQR